MSDSPLTYPRVLIVAGSDSSGGAGIQADIKSCASFGVYSATAITAITVQNTLGVSQVELMDAELVKAQMIAVLTDIGADVIKIGMLGNASIINAVADVIDEYASDITVVLDPVMVATSGASLLEDEAVEALKSRLLPQADIVTPNVPEAQRLTGLDIDDMESMRAAGDTLLKMGAFAAVMKGGHLSGPTVIDLLVTEEGMSIMTGSRLFTRHTHGTGCSLASAIAACLARGMSLETACQESHDYVYEAISSAPKLGSTSKEARGPLNHGLAAIGDVPANDDVTGQTGSELSSGKENPFAVLKDL